MQRYHVLWIWQLLHLRVHVAELLTIGVAEFCLMNLDDILSYWQFDTSCSLLHSANAKKWQNPTTTDFGGKVELAFLRYVGG